MSKLLGAALLASVAAAGATTHFSETFADGAPGRCALLGLPPTLALRPAAAGPPSRAGAAPASAQQRSAARC